MLINLEARHFEGTLILQLPYLSFRNNCVALTELLIKWKTSTKTDGYISSTLVDRNSFNPKQMIFMFAQNEGSNYTYRKPTQFQTYKIQRTELQTAEFKIHLSETEKLANIEKIFFQLKITDAGIQPRSKSEIL